MKHLSLLCFVFSIVLNAIISVKSEISDKHENNKPYQVLDKDVNDAKERWIQNDDEWDNLWDNDLMQHPIDEGPRRVSAIKC